MLSCNVCLQACLWSCAAVTLTRFRFVHERSTHSFTQMIMISVWPAQRMNDYASDRARQEYSWLRLFTGWLRMSLGEDFEKSEEKQQALCWCACFLVMFVCKHACCHVLVMLMCNVIDVLYHKKKTLHQPSFAPSHEWWGQNWGPNVGAKSCIKVWGTPCAWRNWFFGDIRYMKTRSCPAAVTSALQ